MSGTNMADQGNLRHYSPNSCPLFPHAFGNCDSGLPIFKVYQRIQAPCPCSPPPRSTLWVVPIPKYPSVSGPAVY